MHQPLGAPSGYEQIHREAMAWGRWAGVGARAGIARCGSAEGRYVSGYGDAEERPRDTDEVMITEDRAQLIERAILAMPYGERRFVVMAYGRRERRKSLCEKCRISSDLIEGYQIHALRMLGEVIERLDAPPVLIRKGKMLWAGVAKITTPGI